MFVIIGIVVVFGAVIAGYLMEKGPLKVLMQPAELIIIGGAAIGTVLIANPLYVLKAIIGGVAGAFGGSKFSKERYLETMKMMYELFSRARKEGLMALKPTAMPQTKAQSSRSIRNSSRTTTPCISSATPSAWLLAAVLSPSTWIR
jgi:flagellar motor component MotA